MSASLMWFASQFVPTGHFIGQRQAGQLMGQNCVVVHQPDKLFCAVELNGSIRHEDILLFDPIGLHTAF